MATEAPAFKTIRVGPALDVEELKKAQPSGGGRAPSQEMVELMELVRFAATEDNAKKAFPVEVSGKSATNRQRGINAIKRSGMEGIVNLSMQGSTMWFSQERLSNRGRKK